MFADSMHGDQWSMNSCCISTTIKDINNILITSLTYVTKQWKVKVMPIRKCKQHRMYYKYRRKKGEASLTHIGTYLSVCWKVSSFVSTPLAKKFTCSCLWEKENVKILNDIGYTWYRYLLFYLFSRFLPDVAASVVACSG